MKVKSFNHNVAIDKHICFITLKETKHYVLVFVCSDAEICQHTTTQK